MNANRPDLFRLLVSLILPLVFCAHYLLIETRLGGLDAQRSVLVLLMCLAAISLLVNIDSSVAGIFAAVFFGYILSARVPYHPIVKHVTYLFLLGCLVSCFFSIGQQSRWRRWNSIVLASCSILSAFLVVVCGLAYLGAGVTFRWLEVFSYVSNPRFLNHFQVGTFLFLAYHAMRSSGCWRFLFLFGLCAIFFVALLSAGRGVWVSMIFAVIALALTIPGSTLIRMVKALLICFLCGVCLFSVFREFLVVGGEVGFAARGDLLSSSGRNSIWLQTIAAILNRPIFGHGAFSFAIDGAMPRAMPAHPHQHFLQLAYEYGLLLAIGVYSGIIIFVKRAACKIRLDGNVFSGVALASLVALLVNAQFSGLFTMPLGQLVAAMNLGLLIGSLWGDEVCRAQLIFIRVSRAGAVKIALPIILSFSLFFWLAVLADYISGLNGGPMKYSVPHDEHNLSPRTWGNAS